MRCVDWNYSVHPFIALRAGVTPRMRCVDWNFVVTSEIVVAEPVTPRMRCVDWNKWTLPKEYPKLYVTPRMRCVDWNMGQNVFNYLPEWESHLVWGVWIEIFWRCKLLTIVHRHTSYEVCGLKYYEWLHQQDRCCVTPRMRCVDWNILINHESTW